MRQCLFMHHCTGVRPRQRSAKAGHTPGLRRLALTYEVPSFAQVIDALADEIVVEAYTISAPTLHSNANVRDQLAHHFGTPQPLPHEEFKERTHQAELFIRTGEDRPRANVILRCGVAFPI